MVPASLLGECSVKIDRDGGNSALRVDETHFAPGQTNLAGGDALKMI